MKNKILKTMALCLLLNLKYSHGAQNGITPLDSINTEDLGAITLNYSPKKRIIWVAIEKTNKKIIINRFDPNKNPEIVGAAQHISFTTKEIIKIKGKKYIGLTYSHRTRSNNGAGACGSGSEDFFSALEINQGKINIINNFLIQSCEFNYLIDDNGGNELHLAKINDKNEIIFNWLSNPNSTGRTIGIYNFEKNQLSLNPAPD